MDKRTLYLGALAVLVFAIYESQNKKAAKASSTTSTKPTAWGQNLLPG
jgi:hypothetical protein